MSQVRRVEPLHIAVAVFIVLAAFAVYAARSSSGALAYAAEAEFADASAGGLAIVPASCPSNPHFSYQCSCPTAIERPWDAYGALSYPGTVRMINMGVFKCVSNPTGSYFFIPTADYYQAQSFIDVAPYIGVSTFDPY